MGAERRGSPGGHFRSEAGLPPPRDLAMGRARGGAWEGGAKIAGGPRWHLLITDRTGRLRPSGVARTSGDLRDAVVRRARDSSGLVSL